MSVFVNINVSGKKHTIQVGYKPILLGRSGKSNVKFSDPLLSSKHCEISLKQDGKLVITDLNSTNGSFLNDVKIISSHLYIGDILRIGSIEISIDGSRLKPSERAPLTRKSEVGRTKFMDMKVNQKTHAAFKADLTVEDSEKELETKIVDLDEQRKIISERKKLLKRKKTKKRLKKINGPDLEEEVEEKPQANDVISKLLRLFKIN